MRRAAGLAATVTLHAALAAALLFARAVEPPQAAPPPAVDVTILPPETRLTGREEVGQGLACAGSQYEGLGIMVSPGSGRVIDVGPATPAAAAGLREGDILLNDAELGRDRYAAGTELVLRVLRAGRELRLRVRVGVICSE